MGLFLKKTLITIVLAGLAIWVARYGVLQHFVDKRKYSDIYMASDGLWPYAEARFDYGLRAWYASRPEEAKRFFQQAVLIDVFHVDAWLRLAQVENETGNLEHARRILCFTNELTGTVVKWKWPQLMLALDLGMEDIFVRNINFVIPYSPLRNQALELVDRFYNRQTTDVAAVLETENFPAYLQWLIRQRRVADSLFIWPHIAEKGDIADNLCARYVNFLVWQKRIAPAAAIWKQCTGESGLTNPGFERLLSDNAFGWRQTRNRAVAMKRVGFKGVDGGHALEIAFSGKSNIDFHHVQQIVAITPGSAYELSWWWHSRGLTTDQRPLVEVYGYDCTGSRWKSAMVPAETEWRQQRLALSVPEGCNAIAIRIRRHKSGRFDCKIDGRLWLDNFELKKLTAS